MRAKAPSAQEVLATEVHALDGMDLSGLRDAWRSRFGEPPALRSVDLLRRMLAWKIQVEAEGGLDAELKALLFPAATAGRAPKLAPGARVAREWRGVRHDVEVVQHGLLYQGQVYDSLSAIARQITGVRWNGPRFFGLRLKEGA